MQIPLVDLKAQFSSLEPELGATVKSIFENVAFIMGRHVQEFEESFSEYAKCKHTVGVSSGTDALLAAMMALGLDEAMPQAPLRSILGIAGVDSAKQVKV